MINGKAYNTLTGKRVLVVEDEPMIAFDITIGLEEAGAEVLGPAGTTVEALEIAASAEFDAALLDGNLQGKPVYEVAANLARRTIPFLFVTGYGREDLPAEFGHVTVLGKPFSRTDLLRAAEALFLD